MKPPTLQEVEAYIKEKSLNVDPQFFMDYFEASDWIDSRGNKVKIWRLKLLTWHRMNIERGGSHPCSYGSWGSCKKPGVYTAGKDRDGHCLYRCIDHKPQPKPLPLPPQIIPIMKKVPQGDNRSKSDKVNELRKGLGL